MSLICSFSGEVCQDPVCTPNGDIYEKRLILKHIENHGTDPVTKEPLSLDSLVSLKTSLTELSLKPRSSPQQSLPSLMGIFQNEWKEKLLELYNLKIQLQVTQQELNNSLYQFDAACRVIARLTKERDQYREESERLKSKVGKEQPTSEMEVEDKYPGLSDEIKSKIDKTLESLKLQRSQRQTSPTLATREDIKRYSSLGSYPIHKANMPGILSVDINRNLESENLILTGGVDKTAVIFDRLTGKKVSTLSEHTKSVIDARFHLTSDSIITASEDQTVKIWTPSKGSKYSCMGTLKVHEAPITSLDLHPVGDLVLTSSKDKSWAIYDIERCDVLYQNTSTVISSGLNTIRVHPDGAIFATGGEDNTIQIWDLKSQKLIITLSKDLHKDQILDLSFSENGVYLASSSQDNIIGVWDLRGTTKIAHTIQVDSTPSKIRYDGSGKFLASACGSEIRIFSGRNLEYVQTFDEHTKDVTGIQWGRDSKWLATTSLDRSLKIWGSEEIEAE